MAIVEKNIDGASGTFVCNLVFAFVLAQESSRRSKCKGGLKMMEFLICSGIGIAYVYFIATYGLMAMILDSEKRPAWRKLLEWAFSPVLIPVVLVQIGLEQRAQRTRTLKYQSVQEEK